MSVMVQPPPGMQTIGECGDSPFALRGIVSDVKIYRFAVGAAVVGQEVVAKTQAPLGFDVEQGGTALPGADTGRKFRERKPA